MINIGIGVSWAKALYSVANNIIANFRARVLSYPNSIFEAGPCLDATLEELNAIGLLDNASLIVTPNAYNEGVLYDVIPNTPLGDMDVVRATTATRVNSAGLIEVVPRNLFTYSEQFNDTSWTKANATISANVINSPIGTLTADKLVENSANDIHYINGSSITFTAGTYSVSIFAKAAERNVLQIFLNGSANVDAYANFNLTTGVVSAFNAATATIQSFGDGWYRCILTTTVASSTVPSAYFCIQNSTTATRAASYLGNGTSGLFIWGAQLENFASATEYFPTTTRLNIPRIDYTNGSCPSLLVEPQRTNVATYSEDFTNVSWPKLECSITSNTTNSPSGILNADSLIESTSNGRHMLYKAFTSVIGTSYALSVFCKQNTRRYANINLKTTTTASPRFSALFDLQTGTNVSTSSVGTPTGTSFSIVPYGNGWYKISITMIAASTSTELEISASSTSTPTLSEGSPSYLGDGTSGIYLWGAQLEQGAYPTSYIPTVASTVTRNADVISKTGISSLIGQTEGTLYWDATNLFTSGTRSLALMYTSGSSFFQIYLNSSNQIRVDINGSFLFLGGSISANTQYKIAFAYKSGNYALYLNGVQIATSTSTTIPSTLNDLYIGNSLGSEQSGSYKSVQLYKTRLTDEQLTLITGDSYNSYAEMANSLNYILE
jgi:hypothetical protein